MNMLSLLFFFPALVCGTISVEKMDDLTILQINTYKTLQIDSDRSTCEFRKCQTDNLLKY